MNILDFRKPISFGLDIGNGTVKVIQINNKNTRKVVSGYGVNVFDPQAVREGEIVNQEALEKCINELLESKVVGAIDANNVVVSIPATHIYTRVVTMPKVSAKDLEQTVVLEAEQYIPTSIAELYIDYDVIAQSSEQMEVLVVAAPRRIIDSYVKLFDKLNLKITSIEPSMGAIIRMLNGINPDQKPSLVIDLGSLKSNLAVMDGTVRVTGYTSSGGNQLTDAISKELKVKPAEASKIKAKEGLLNGPNQDKIEKAISPILNNLFQEVRRMIAYYNKRHPSKEDISEVILVGGSSKIPGLDKYIQDKLGLSTSLPNPMSDLEFNRVTPPAEQMQGIYSTVIGLALANYEKAYQIKNEVLIDEDIEDTNIEESGSETENIEKQEESETNTEEVKEEDKLSPNKSTENLETTTKKETESDDSQLSTDDPDDKSSKSKDSKPKKDAKKKAAAKNSDLVKTGKDRF